MRWQEGTVRVGWIDVIGCPWVVSFLCFSAEPAVCCGVPYSLSSFCVVAFVVFAFLVSCVCAFGFACFAACSVGGELVAGEAGSGDHGSFSSCRFAYRVALRSALLPVASPTRVAMVGHSYPIHLSLYVWKSRSFDVCVCAWCSLVLVWCWSQGAQSVSRGCL